MRISRSWISDYVDLSGVSTAELENLITTRIAEVDGVHIVGSPIDSALVGEIKAVSAHPTKESLKIASVNIGTTSVDVVCGAPNCRVGIFVVYVPIGAVVNSPTSGELVAVVEKEIAGVKSNGVLVSEAELGISANHSGIFEFSRDCAIPGESVSKVLGGSDAVFEIDNKSLTHRPDLWSHYGFAREIAAVLNRPLKLSLENYLDGKSFSGSGASQYKIQIQNKCGCRRFSLIEISGVKCIESPLWLRRRLFSVGAGVRNLIIDLSNYVMHDTGQPNHAYDADLLKSKDFGVRLAKKNEKITALDGMTYDLTERDIVITSGDKSVALGGVIGGGEASIQEATTRVILESANFDPVTIRLTTKRHAIRTDASNRFEKSLSPSAVPLAQGRFIELLKSVLPEISVVGVFNDCFPEQPAPVSIKVSYDYIRSRLGAELSDSKINEILTSLGLKFNELESTNEAEYLIPYYRATRDLSIQDDLVEEVGRIYGYENISEQSPKIDSRAARPRPVAEFEVKAREILAGLGLSEVYLYSFMNESQASKLGFDTETALRVKNPVDANSPLIRASLVPGLVEVIEQNLKNYETFGCFELGRTYRKESSDELDKYRTKDRVVKNEPTKEARLLGLVFAGTANEKSDGEYFYFLAGVLRRLSFLVGIHELEFKPIKSEAPKWMHPGRSAEVIASGVRVGVIAEVCPGMLDAQNSRAVISEIDVELLVGRSKPSIYKPVPKFPNSFFEISVIMPKHENYSALDSILRKVVSPELLKSVDLLSVYQGAPLKSEEKSVSVKLHLGRDDRTLSSEELKSIQESIINTIRNSEYSLRG